MVRYSNGGLKTGMKKACLWSKMSNIQMVGQFTWLYHLNTEHTYCHVFRWVQYSGVQYSVGYCINFFVLIFRKRFTWETVFTDAVFAGSTPCTCTRSSTTWRTFTASTAGWRSLWHNINALSANSRIRTKENLRDTKWPATRDTEPIEIRFRTLDLSPCERSE